MIEWKNIELIAIVIVLVLIVIVIANRNNRENFGLKNQYTSIEYPIEEYSEGVYPDGPTPYALIRYNNKDKNNELKTLWKRVILLLK